MSIRQRLDDAADLTIARAVTGTPRRRCCACSRRIRSRHYLIRIDGPDPLVMHNRCHQPGRFNWQRLILHTLATFAAGAGIAAAMWWASTLPT